MEDGQKLLLQFCGHSRMQ